MADTYIAPGETVVYGEYCREQMRDEVLPLLEECAGIVGLCIARQKEADEKMAAVLARVPAPVVDGTDPVEETRDFIQRFAGYVSSIKGHPVPLSVFFGRDVPSKVARRRALKLVATMKVLSEKLTANAAKMPGSSLWLEELEELRPRLDAYERSQRAQRTAVVDVRPELAEARDAWLEVYAVNKHAIESVLMLAKKTHLMDVIFDDLAEVQRTRRPADDVTGGDVDGEDLVGNGEDSEDVTGGGS
jgi:hypothetical protein